MMRSGLLPIVLLSLVTMPSAAQQQGEISEQARVRGHRMLRQIREQLEKDYYDSTYHGIPLEASALRTDSAIDAAQTMPQMMGVLAQFLENLNDSHTRFYPPGVNVEVQYGWSWRTVGNDCYVSAVKEESDAEAQGLQVGDRVLAIDGIKPTRANLGMIGYVYYQLSPRPGMRVIVEHADGEREELTIRSEMKRRRMVVDNTDLEERRRQREAWQRSRPRHRTVTFGDSVLVWRLPAFIYGDRNIDRIMRRARDHRHLILDLRGNGGGAVATLERLLGHFFGEEFVYGTMQFRDKEEQQSVKPVGHEPFGGEVIVLIDSQSASASEITARTLQMRGRATIVGDRSAGAVMVSISRSLHTGGWAGASRGYRWGMSVTISDLILPDGNSLEHRGVIPNVAVLPTQQDLAEKRDPAMAFALELTGVMVSADEAAEIYDNR